jgi:hypothetical protein
MTLEQRIQAEKKHVSGEIEGLKKELETEQEVLKDLQQDYHNAILNGSDEDIDFVNQKIKEVKNRIKIKQDKINAFSELNNPKIQNMVSEQLVQWSEEIPVIQKQISEKEKQVAQLRQEFLKGLVELNDLIKNSRNLRSSINHYRAYLNERNIEKVSEYHVDIWSDSRKIRDFFINDRDVFK